MDSSLLLGEPPVRPTPWWTSTENRSTLLKISNDVWKNDDGFSLSGIYVYSLPHIRKSLKKLKSLKSLSKYV